MISNAYMDRPDQRDWRAVFVFGGTAVGLLACTGGLYIAAGLLGIVVGVGIILVTLASPQPIGFALGQAGVAAVLASDTALPVLVAVEAGLIVALLATLGRVSTTSHTLVITATSLIGFLVLTQVLQNGFSHLTAALAAVGGPSLVVYLIHRVEYVRLKTVAEADG
jgi:hypothetical protein